MSEVLLYSTFVWSSLTLVFREYAENQVRTGLQIENSLINRVPSDPPEKNR